ncbi:Phosphate uptake regulator [Rubrobacter radiotolerans]|uniref:Phosphate uptake regulator n=1 Tax=Rubrobacter radiotolerans TaxID=42256 RepID=A0A023X0Y6_RUBRA|nr:phosphate uptake regulator PhoU [Rubrobacter radiotolerans]AHY45988.1 Phosphate uptake regulator [Rubrobacter radiotolerans]MDX5893400.1 phosphate uptake regulator PhoU [Rubrobacter radiotolerans]SMC03657.1 phosphate transport system protein [Rubrobacter radiotolerans DSM 5868]
MARETFQQELDELISEVIVLGRDVIGTLEKMVKAMEGDASAASSEVGVDSSYKARGQRIESECLILQLRQAPVAKDLRLIYSAMSLTNHIVRSGTLAEHICQAIADTAGHERDEDLQQSLTEMARTARNIFRQGLDVFETRDIDRAHDLQASDDKVDLLYSEALNLIANPPDSGSGTPEWRMRAALMVHYLERIADHGVDIGGMTVFLVTGERIQDAMEQYMNRDLPDD